ncbi:hypothetical protein V2P29_01920 [Mesomycoplasma hyorhinis]|uniref:Uncharacterized protein n=2 Tax=Mesomycoplasma hyorhinis TaxID=2100 RepID=A0ABD6IDU9_MESHY|nr:hypothetical protein [Mesomycoplasma hyorhinis]AEC45587.1 hypothetical protein SRH_00080 [Mesomycoplasma hyorhinis MCLD]AEX14006.1 hypothetical protein MYM_0219 [Mesomycoplasma hyorhinis GDL-1]AHA40984.1 hypothetical protein Q453_0237 [Mesomycoplasma hyorhinis DBS 1050]AOD25218.1 hypothetical protein MHMDBK_00259 [Mesomycoplasma hyorhinis]MXR08009.1 hypothetical protein [Mesomycoplasma hyorhinis]
MYYYNIFFNHFYFKKDKYLFSLDLLLFWKFTKFFGLKSYIFQSLNLLLYKNPEKVNFVQKLEKIKQKCYKKEAFLMFSENYIINKVQNILAKNPKIKFKFESWKHKLIFSVINDLEFENTENKKVHYKNIYKLKISSLIFYCFYLLNDFNKNKNSQNKKMLKEW